MPYYRPLWYFVLCGRSPHLVVNSLGTSTSLRYTRASQVSRKQGAGGAFALEDEVDKDLPFARTCTHTVSPISREGFLVVLKPWLERRGNVGRLYPRAFDGSSSASDVVLHASSGGVFSSSQAPLARCVRVQRFFDACVCTQLHLPPYSKYEVLSEKLRYAIDNSRGVIDRD